MPPISTPAARRPVSTLTLEEFFLEYPRIAGAQDPPPSDPPPGDPPAGDPPAGDPPAGDPPDPKLGDPGKKALDEERKARRDAEKRAKDAEAKLKQREDADLSETERLKKEAEDARAKVSTATEKLQRANLLTALGEKGLNGARAKAAARLLDDVQYDDDDEPANLDAAMTAAKAEYGDDIFAATRAGGSFDGGNRNGDGPPDNNVTPGLGRIAFAYDQASKKK